MPFWLVDGNLRTLYFSYWLWRCFWSRSPWIVLLATPTRLTHTTTVFKHKCVYVHPDTQIAGSWARVWQPSLGITAESSRVVQWKWAARIHRTQSVGRRLVWPTPPCLLPPAKPPKTLHSPAVFYNLCCPSWGLSWRFRFLYFCCGGCGLCKLAKLTFAKLSKISFGQLILRKVCLFAFAGQTYKYQHISFITC